MINLNQPILNIGGDVSRSKSRVPKMVEGDNGEMVESYELVLKDVTLGSMLRSAVLKGNGDYEPTSVLTRYNLFKKLNLPEEGVVEVDLTDEEQGLLVPLVCQAFEIFYAGQIIETLTK